MKSKLQHFLFGYSRTSREKSLYLIKRFLWCSAVYSAIKYWIFFFYGIIMGEGFSSIPIVFPAICATGIALLLSNFD